MNSQRRQLGLLEEEIGKALTLLGEMTTSASGLQNVLSELETDTTKGFEALGTQVDLLKASNSGVVEEKLEKVQEILRSGQKHLEGKVKEAESAVENLFTKMESGYDHLAKELKGLSNVESVLLDTGDSVLDTKRRLEYGVQQIMGEIRNQLKDYTTSLNTSLQHR
jgi:dsDNA-specific endonuclease/ATPase MutS2